MGFRLKLRESRYIVNGPLQIVGVQLAHDTD